MESCLSITTTDLRRSQTILIPRKPLKLVDTTTKKLLAPAKKKQPTSLQTAIPRTPSWSKQILGHHCKVSKSTPKLCMWCNFHTIKPYRLDRLNILLQPHKLHIHMRTKTGGIPVILGLVKKRLETTSFTIIRPCYFSHRQLYFLGAFVLDKQTIAMKEK